jgi:hypothetical protein
MALTIALTPKELQRQASLAFEGKSYKVFLAYNPSATLGTDSTTASWSALELPAQGGYAPVSGTLGVGSYNATLARYELPTITAQFSGQGVGFVYDVLVVVIDDAAYPHSIARIAPEQSLAAGQSRSFVIRLLQDD